MPARSIRCDRCDFACLLNKINDWFLKGEVHPKRKVSYLVVFGALTQKLKARGACDKPFWIHKRLKNCAALRRARDDVLVVAVT